MVKFIVGKADLNISAAVRGELVSLLEKSAEKRKILCLVPDQFEYETEKAVYRLLDEKGLLKRFYEIRTTTFSALCRDILEEYGEHRPFADDIVKSVIMHKTLSENRNALSALNRIASRTGFCGKMVKTVSALKTAGITAKDLELSLCALENIDKSFSDKQPIVRKLHETELLYENYEVLMNKYIDKLDVTAMAAGLAAKSETAAFDGADVFVDCFNDFTHSQLEFLKQMITKAKSVTFGFTSQLDSDCGVFRTPNGHIGRLRQFAEENGLSAEFVTEGIKSRFPESSPLIGISKHLFQNAKHRPALGDACELITARSVYEELDYAAAKIKQLTIDKGMRYNEIAVLCTDVGEYGKYVESAFKKFDIPVFLDTPEPILYQPLINLVNSILNALNDFSVDSVLSCVKTGFFAKSGTELDTDEEDDDEEFIDDDGEELFEENIQLTLFDAFGDENVKIDAPRKSNKRERKITLSAKDIDCFESYIYEWDLKAKHLKKPFELCGKQTDDDLTRQTAERVRKAVAVPLLELRKKLRKDGNTVNGGELTELLYDFLVNEVGMRRAIFKRCKNESNTALDADKVALYQRLWNSLADILDKLHEELSDTNVTVEEYRDIFREICTAVKLADPPRFIDCVLVGDIDRTRADNIKAAFIVGAAYELFPTPAAEAGIFSQYEIELICDKLIHIDADGSDKNIAKYIETMSNIGNGSRREYALKSAADQYDLSLYRAYRAMTLPTEYLCVSCPEINIEGEATARSDVFTDVITTFDGTRIIDAEKERDDLFYCRTLKAAKMRYAMGLDGRYGDNSALRSVLERKDGEFVAALDEIREQRRDVAYDASGGSFSGQHSIEPKTARLLFPASVGTTALEKLNKCKFEFFCEYGLKITERNKRSFTSGKRGEAIHFIFQNVLREYSGDMDAFFRLRRSELLSLSKKYLAVYRENETNNDSSEDKRTEYLFNNIANSAADVLITVQTELFARKYRPKFFELNIKDGGRHALIDNENNVTAKLPEAEVYSENEEQPDAPKTAASDENAPYLITAPLELTLDDGTEITVQGIIDRVDMFKAGESGGKPVAYVRVVDYKTSAHSFDLHNAENGVNIQMLLYLFALQSANENNPSLELRAGGVDYIPSKNRGALDEAASPYRILAMNYHESGLFIKDEMTQSDLESYKKLVFDKLDKDGFLEPKELETLKSSFEPNPQNTAESAYFDDLRENVLKKVRENLGAVFGGKIDALPLNYYELEIQTDGKPRSKAHKTCDYCIFKEICGNAGKNIIKIENTGGKKPACEWENRYITGKENGNGKRDKA